MLYSASTRGFYDRAVHATIPADAVEITAVQHADLLARQMAGHAIVPGAGGRPKASAPVPLPLEERRVRAIDAVKREARRRIEIFAPIWRQLNDARDLPLSIGASRQAIEARFARIDAVRAASNQLERTIAGLNAQALSALDIHSNRHWPED